MKYLLDTHTFLWWILDYKELSGRVRGVLADINNPVFFSVVSGWEIAIKHSIGRLKLTSPPKRFVREQLLETAFPVLDIRVDHALEVSELPLIHNDPFDRLLISQCRCDGLTLLTRDRILQRYPIDVCW